MIPSDPTAIPSTARSLSASRSSYRPSAVLRILAIGALIVVPLVVYAGFIFADTGDGFYSKNISGSMAPTILEGDFLTSRGVAHGPDDLPVIHRGDLVIHTLPTDPRKQYVKRIVGLPGDTLSMVEGRLIVNNHAVTEPYAHRDEPSIDPVSDDFAWQRQFVIGPAAADPSKYVASRNNWGPLVVPHDAYFVLGDNRDNSLDSRYWGFVSGTQLQARVRRVYFSQDSASRIRWSRLGKRLQ